MQDIPRTWQISFRSLQTNQSNADTVSFKRPDGNQSVQVDISDDNTNLDDANDAKNIYPNKIHRGESEKDFHERVKLQNKIYHWEAVISHNDGVLLSVKGKLDLLHTWLPILRNAKCVNKQVMLCNRGIEWYKYLLDGKNILDHLREIRKNLSTNPQYQISLPYTNEIAFLELHQDNREFSKISRAKALKLTLKQWIHSSRNLNPKYRVFKNVEHAREKATKLKAMNLNAQTIYLDRVNDMLSNVIEQFKDEHNEIQASSSVPLEHLREELSGLVQQLVAYYNRAAIPRKKIGSSPDEIIERPQMSELWRLIVEMHKETKESNAVPDVEAGISEFLEAFMIPISTPGH